MANLTPNPKEDAEFWSGLKTGLRRAVLIALALLGLVAAAEASEPVGYACGIGGFAGVVGLLFWELKRHCDGLPPLRLADIIIDDFSALMVGLPVFVILALAGLVLAASAGGGTGYYAGLAVSIAAVLLCFRSIAACYDRAEAEKHR